MPTRRDFLATLGGAALGVTALSRVNELSATEASNADKLERIGIQLYTLRSLVEKDFEGTLARVAEIGYKEVEFAGYFGRTPAQVREVLRKNGLTSPSSHIPVPADDSAWARNLEEVKAIGNEWVVIPWIDAAQRSKPDDWPRWAERFNSLAAKAKQAGLRFAYHNHDFEFMKVGDSSGLEVLLSRTDPKLVDFEMDLYWIVKGGGDPLDLFKRYPGRFPLLHVKDATAAPERTMTDVGSGTIDFAKIFAARRMSGMKHVYVEHYNPTDPMESARKSYRYLAALRW
jgi:sugar phosphate isomerase/epimerase